MILIDNDSTPYQQTSARKIDKADAHARNVITYQSEVHEETWWALDASEAREGASGISDDSSDRMYRLEWLLEGMAQRQVQFLANQSKMHNHLSRRAEAAPTPPSDHLFNGSTVFT